MAVIEELWKVNRPPYTRTGTLSRSREMHTRLEAARLPIGTKTISSELIGLPAPVQKYFRAVLKDGQRIVSAVYVELSGTFNMSGTGEKWKRFTSTRL